MAPDLVTTAILEKVLSKVFEGFRKITQTVRIQENPDSFAFVKVKRATSTAEAFVDTPNIEIFNPLDKKITVRSISYIPDSVFKTGGILKIKINDVKVFDSSEEGNFTNVAEDTITFKEGKTIDPTDSVKAFFYNATDNTELALTIKVMFGE